jgi:aminobenzoyl-glutamate utilization protein B
MFIIGSVVSALAQSSAGTTSANLVESIEAKRALYADVAMQIWNFAEIGYQEAKSSALLQQQLKNAGFAVQAGVAEIPTAFVATYGAGRPVIGIIGEFDALPGLSQAAVPVRKPLIENGAGHGCGHHLFGTGSVAAAIAVKDWLASTRTSGTIKFFGTPAEEGGSAKVYMLRAGLFDGVDTVVAWHPFDSNAATASSSLANVSGKFRFRGVAAHAANAPHRGRSALDGVEAMNAMVNLMREHVPSDARIHYVITRGGVAPNVVPDFAEVYYYARHNDMRVLDDIWERIVNAAKGAALGTGTSMELEITGAVWNRLPNDYLAGLVHSNLLRVGGYDYSDEERAFAETLRKSLEGTLPSLDAAKTVQKPETGVRTGSSDVGDVSWNTPTVELTSATWVPGTPPHTWQAAAAGGTTIGIKGMMIAAKVMALTAAELFTSPTHIEKARQEFEQKRGATFKYTTRLADRKPPLDYRK